MKMLLIEQNYKIIQLLKFAKDTKTNKLTSVGNVAKSINLIENRQLVDWIYKVVGVTTDTQVKNANKGQRVTKVNRFCTINKD